MSPFRIIVAEQGEHRDGRGHFELLTSSVVFEIYIFSDSLYQIWGPPALYTISNLMFHIILSLIICNFFGNIFSSIIKVHFPSILKKWLTEDGLVTKANLSINKCKNIY